MREKRLSPLNQKAIKDRKIDRNKLREPSQAGSNPSHETLSLPREKHDFPRLQENKQNVRRPLASPPQLYVCPIHEAVIVLESNHCATSEYKGLVAEFSDLTSFPPYPTKYKMLRLPAYSNAHARIHVGVMMTPVCLVKSVLI